MQKSHYQQELLKQAFADDEDLYDFNEDTIEDGLLEKKNVKNQTHKDLPGWGSWTGPGINDLLKNSKKRGKMNDQLFGKGKEREEGTMKKRRIGHVIYNEAMNKALKQVLPQTVPYDFGTKKSFFRDYGSRIISDKAIAPLEYKELVKPKISTKKGIAIRPMKKADRSDSDDDDTV